MSASQDQPLNLRNPHRPIHAGVLLLGGTTELLDIAPIDLLHGITPTFISTIPEGIIPNRLREQAVDIRIHYVAEKMGVAQVTSGMGVTVTDTFDTVPDLDILLLGATMNNYQPTPAEMSFVRATHTSPTCQALLTICGGILPLLPSGVLSPGSRATAPRPMLGLLRETAPHVEWTERRWERWGKVWSSGALLNGLDMMRVWAGEVWGVEGEGEESLVDFMLGFGGWPVRDGGYADDDARVKMNGGGKADEVQVKG